MKRMFCMFIATGWTLSTIGSAYLACGVEDRSINAVGYQKFTCTRGKAVLAVMNFEKIGGGEMKSQNAFGTQVPDGTKIHAFNTASKNFITDTRTARGWSTNITFKTGMGFWICIPDNAPQEKYDVAIMGQIPATESTSVIDKGISLLSNPFPANTAWTNTALAKSALPGDKLIIRTEGGDWKTYSYSSTKGWGDVGNLIIKLNMAFWYETSSGPRTNLESRPFQL